MKIHFNYLILVSLFLTGCYVGVSESGYKYIGIDWNNNQLDKRLSYKQAAHCSQVQRSIARNKLKNLYNENMASEIYSKCIDNPNYKFESDPKYSNY